MILSFIFFKKIIKTEFKENWIKIFHHNSQNGDFFINSNEVLFSNKTNKYSILGYINDSWKINNSFEFLLEYPQLIGYNRWKQSLHPKDNPEIGDNNKAIGYEAINITWKEQKWGGLVKSNPGDQTFIDGSCGSIGHYWYSIGLYVSFNGGIPGPNYIVVNEVILWIRTVNSSNEYSTLKVKFSKRTLPSFSNNLRIIVAFFFSFLRINY